MTRRPGFRERCFRNPDTLFSRMPSGVFLQGNAPEPSGILVLIPRHTPTKEYFPESASLICLRLSSF